MMKCICINYQGDPVICSNFPFGTEFDVSKGLWRTKGTDLIPIGRSRFVFPHDMCGQEYCLEPETVLLVFEDRRSSHTEHAQTVLDRCRAWKERSLKPAPIPDASAQAVA